MLLDKDNAIKVVVTRIDDVIVQPLEEEVLGILLPMQLADIIRGYSDIVVANEKFDR